MRYVLVQAAITEYYRLHGLDNKHLFLTVLEAWVSRTEVLAGLVSAEGLLPGWQVAAFLPYPHMVKREREGETELSSLAL